MPRVNDRIAFPRLRNLLDLALGDLVADTLVLRLPELLQVRSEHFTDSLTPAQKRRLFATSVRWVEIETHSYCNRQCWFCPNLYIDRRSHREYLPCQVYTQIIADLRAIGYRNILSFSRYNEPFGDEVIYDRIAEARHALPTAILRANSNSDFVGLVELDRMSAAGLNHLDLTCYPAVNTDWTMEHAERQIAKKAEKLRLLLRRRHHTPGSIVSYSSTHKTLDIRVYCPNIVAGGTDRGGTVAGVPTGLLPRESPCMLPFGTVYIDYNGKAMLCCQVRSDIASHHKCILGRVDAQPLSLFAAWGSAAAAQWRRALVTYGSKPDCCQHCYFHEWASQRSLRALHDMLLRLGCALPLLRSC